MSRILVALDFDAADTAISLAEALSGHVAGFKVGLQLLFSQGPQMVARISALGLPVFADAKLHDIPNTVHRASMALARAGARWVSVHPGGGEDMVSAAVEGLGEGVGALVVSHLTSLPPARWRVGEAAALALASGAEGVVCAPLEAGLVKQTSNRLLAVTPGVRRAGAEPHDQVRVGTAAEAVAAGADLLVVGRTITEAADPVGAAIAISAEADAAVFPSRAGRRN